MRFLGHCAAHYSARNARTSAHSFPFCLTCAICLVDCATQPACRASPLLARGYTHVTHTPHTLPLACVFAFPLLHCTRAPRFHSHTYCATLDTSHLALPVCLRYLRTSLGRHTQTTASHRVANLAHRLLPHRALFLLPCICPHRTVALHATCYARCLCGSAHLTPLTTFSLYPALAALQELIFYPHWRRAPTPAPRLFL